MSGIGRGRGWLSVNKNLNAKPGVVNTNEKLIYDFNSTIMPASSPKLTTKYTSILANISIFSENDDGILMNQKLKVIVDEFKKVCQSAQEVQEAFENIHETCLNDDEFRVKAIGVACTQSFNSISVHGVKLRNLFITQFQNDFDNCKQIQINNPNFFRSIVKMLGDFYNKARLLDGQPLKFLSSPMLKYLEMLLESSQDADVQLFTLQLYMNGNRIKEELPSQLNELLIQVRNILVHNEISTATRRLWLMLALDISNNRYNLPPSEIHKFYITHLGEEAMNQIKKVNTELRIQTSIQNLSLDNIQSTVNVLQPVTNSDSWEAPSTMSAELEKTHPIEIHTSYPTKPRSYRKTESGFNNIGTWEQPKNEKTPRPILGAGVRLKHSENKNPDDANWRDRKSDNEWSDANTNSNWDNKKKGGTSGWSNDGNKLRKNISKGWEHDDRFEQEYN